MYKQKNIAAVIVAAGSSTRMGFDKLLYKYNGKEVLLHSIEALCTHPYVDSLVVVAGKNLAQIEALLAQNPPCKPYVIVPGGSTRTASVEQGVLAGGQADIVAVHDGARPFVSAQLITRTIEAAAETGAAAPAVPVKDTIKQEENGYVAATPVRAALKAVQTPQVFDKVAFLQALSAIPKEEYPLLTDDCMVMERARRPVVLVPGEETNKKITTPEDLPVKQEGKSMLPRIGHGYDVHRLVAGRPLILGGVVVPHEKGLLGHSDADVLAHVVSDALLGAAALGDIGRHFPDNDEKYKGANSLQLLNRCAEIVRQAGFEVGNIDATLLCQAPKLMPHIPDMRRNLAQALDVPIEQVSVKATTEEKLGFTGEGLGIAAHCVAMIFFV